MCRRTVLLGGVVVVNEWRVNYNHNHNHTSTTTTAAAAAADGWWWWYNNNNHNSCCGWYRTRNSRSCTATTRIDAFLPPVTTVQQYDPYRHRSGGSGGRRRRHCGILQIGPQHHHHHQHLVATAVTATVFTIPNNSGSIKNTTAPSTTPHSTGTTTTATTATAATTTPRIVTAAPTVMTSPRLWLESLPVGAYTVIRCDYHNTNNNTIGRTNTTTTPISTRNHDGCCAWTIWGRQFHIERLKESFMALVNSTTNASKDRESGTKENDDDERLLDVVDDNSYYSNMLQRAHNDTIAIVNHMMMMEPIVPQQDSVGNGNEPTATTTTAAAAVVIMLTILWFANVDDPTHIVVCGHAVVASAAAAAANPLSNQTWNVVVDIKSTTTPTTATPTQQHDTFIHRQSYPQPMAKISSWCRQRRPLESRFMRPPTSTVVVSHQPSNRDNDTISSMDQQQRPQEMIGLTPPAITAISINEIILTQQQHQQQQQQQQKSTTTDRGNNCIQLLEGLTSNVFVVYPNHVIRTTGNGVLHGYVRYLILQLLSSSSSSSSSVSSTGSHNDATTTMIPVPNYTIDTTSPILLEDADDWQEVFCTSSIRLIVPVERVFVACDNINTNDTSHSDSVDILDDATTKTITSTGAEIREIWCSKTLESHTEQVWKTLRKMVLNHHRQLDDSF